MINTPILLIGFNRPDVIQKSLAAISKVKPKTLYVAIDGERKHLLGEKELVNAVKSVVKEINWDCTVKYLFRDNNLGCKNGVTSAITWAFENEDRLIIIEDDIVATPAFFTFAEELLNKHLNDNQISMISANQYTPIEIEDDYIFTKYGHIWGWATWKRVWDKFNVDLPNLIQDLEFNKIEKLNLSRDEKRYFTKFYKSIANQIIDDTINTWDFQFFYFRLINNYLSIVPRTNLASNIGVNSSRTDQKITINENYFPSDNNFKLVKQPNQIMCNESYDYFHFKTHIKKRRPLMKRVFNKIKKIIN